MSNPMLGTLIKAMVDYEGSKLEELGTKIGQLYTDHGLPPDMALDRLGFPKDQKLLILHAVCEWLIEHKRRSGGTDESIERQRSVNRRMLESFYETGEVGIY